MFLWLHKWEWIARRTRRIVAFATQPIWPFSQRLDSLIDSAVITDCSICAWVAVVAAGSARESRVVRWWFLVGREWLSTRCRLVVASSWGECLCSWEWRNAQVDCSTAWRDRSCRWTRVVHRRIRRSFGSRRVVRTRSQKLNSKRNSGAESSLEFMRASNRWAYSNARRERTTTFLQRFLALTMLRSKRRNPKRSRWLVLSQPRTTVLDPRRSSDWWTCSPFVSR